MKVPRVVGLLVRSLSLLTHSKDQWFDPYAFTPVPRPRVVMLRSGAALLFVSALFCSPTIAFSQQFRGTILGVVRDPSGAVISGAQITLTDLATNATLVTETNGEGFYTIEYIAPGRYSLRIDATGFQAMTLENVDIRIGDRLTIDRTLSVAQTEASVLVTGDSTPLLERASASLGQVIDRRRIEELPLLDGNPFILARLAPSVVITDVTSLRFTRPFDHNAIASISTNGTGSQTSEFTLDGVPNNVAFGRQVAYVPPADAVQEFKVVTSSFNAQEGHSAGAHIDVASRMGKNRPFGSIYWFNRPESLTANEFFVNANPACDRDSNGRCRGNPQRYDRYGGTFGGPVMVPHLGSGGPRVWSGKDRVFFFFAYEGLRQVAPTTSTFTVPTPAMRNGDFSALLPGIVIYDPATAFLRPDGRVERRPFPGNIIPADRISPIGKNFLSYWPLPNVPCADAQCRNNLIAPIPRTDVFNSVLVRVDAMLTDRHRFFVRYSHNRRNQDIEGFSGVINGVDPTTAAVARSIDGVAIDEISTLSTSTLLNIRAGLTRFDSVPSRAAEGVFDATSLGFSPSTTALFRQIDYFPLFTVTNFNPNTGGVTFGAPLSGRQHFDVFSFQPTLTKVVGAHTLRTGYDFRVYRDDEYPGRNEAGLYVFDAGQVATRQFSDSPAASIGQELAAVLLGQPSGGSIDRNADGHNQLLYHALFFQDDWNVNARLTLNLGVRWDMELPPAERFNRNLRGFDATSPSPIETAARAAYAANPIPQIPIDAFRVRGGLTFASETNRGFYNADTNNVQPRAGFAYALNSKTVVRGGFAMYSVPFYIDAVNQSGFSQSTLLVPTVDAGLTFQANLANPFPAGVLQPPGASLGLATSLGQNISVVPVDRKNALSRRYMVSLQRELPGRVLVDVAFVRNVNYDMPVSVDLNPVPRQYLTTLNQRDPAADNFLLAQVPNPFKGLLPGTPFNGATIQRQQLLRPFPQFGSIISERYDGQSFYNALQLRVERRFLHGYTVNGSYTFSRLIEEMSLLNPTDASFERRISPGDYPHRLVISGIYELPFGKGRRFLSAAGNLLDSLVGGYQVQAIYQYQSGHPLVLGNVAYFGDPNALQTDITGQTVSTPRNPNRVVFDTSGFVSPGVDIRLRNNVRTLPSTFTRFRSQPINQLDGSLIKNVNVAHGRTMQLRIEVINATNSAQFGEPNLDPTSSTFGRVTSQANLPRSIQVGLRFVF